MNKVTRRAGIGLVILLSTYFIGYGVAFGSCLSVLYGTMVVVLGMVYLGKDGNKKHRHMDTSGTAHSSTAPIGVFGKRNRSSQIARL